jgi:hypothetical protein
VPVSVINDTVQDFISNSTLDTIYTCIPLQCSPNCQKQILRYYQKDTNEDIPKRNTLKRGHLSTYLFYHRRHRHSGVRLVKFLLSNITRKIGIMIYSESHMRLSVISWAAVLRSFMRLLTDAHYSWLPDRQSNPLQPFNIFLFFKLSR